MSPVTRANLLLAAAALALGLALWRTLPPDGPALPPLTPLDPAAIREIRIETGGRLVAHLVRSGDGWRNRLGQRPVKDGEWIDRLLHIAVLPSLRRFPASDDLAPFGLDPPRHRLVLDGLVLEWGGLEPSGRRRYVRVGKTIHLVTDGYTHHLRAAGDPP